MGLSEFENFYPVLHEQGCRHSGTIIDGTGWTARFQVTGRNILGLGNGENQLSPVDKIRGNIIIVTILNCCRTLKDIKSIAANN